MSALGSTVGIAQSKDMRPWMVMNYKTRKAGDNTGSGTKGKAVQENPSI